MPCYHATFPRLLRLMQACVIVLVPSGCVVPWQCARFEVTAERSELHSPCRADVARNNVRASHLTSLTPSSDAIDGLQETPLLLDNEPSRQSIRFGEESSPNHTALYTSRLEQIAHATSPPQGMDSWESREAAATLNSSRYEELKDYQRRRNSWFVSRAASGLKGKAEPSKEELEFREKRRRYKNNNVVQFLADHDADRIQQESITYQSINPPVEQYMQMINSVRRDRFNIQVTPAPATLPHPSVAYTPFHKEISKQKNLEKKFRVHYMTGGGRKSNFFYNPEDDCYWKVQADGTVACVMARDLADKPHHDPTIAVAIDQTGMFDTLEEATAAISLQCSDFYLEKSTWTYYCLPAFSDLRPEDYKRMKRYKNRINEYWYHRWAVQKAQELDIPELHRPPRPTGGVPPPQRDANYNPVAAKLKEKDEAKQAKKQFVQQAAAFLEENHPEPEAVISAANAQYPLQEGVIIVRPSGYTVEPAPALDAASAALLAAVNKKFAELVVTSAFGD
ncbi:conserved hypothetical protein [Neospora caninum Liverpool]|uniref:Transmembrane protein n=1 Tax=Neospora caninum (strain Liverpool) TaxID=572307 RepID=F0VI33_NEOCL|nr:conserved hypothetical protein [Neospora caninum Liverpool]CBZ53394.1 conserved hypothetical protein [Neospora caninum Liverpool]CEL67381.1 TPA: hypothetical protein BN1204_031810 [Neospora caninum Liverpool]|eukprot:XP_003883426.1 conserved hypothetical protein [Neospora caninum Liverpool]